MGSHLGGSARPTIDGMSETLGCPEDHTSTSREWRVGLATTADQGTEFNTWPGPHPGIVAEQP